MSLLNHQSQVEPIWFRLRNRIRFNRAMLIFSNTLLIGVLLHLLSLLLISFIVKNGAFDELLQQQLLYLVIAASVGYLLLELRRSNYLRFSFAQIAEHLNREQSAYQESAQLLLQPVNSLSELQFIQYQKVLKLFEQEIANQTIYQYAPAVRNRLVVIFIIVFLSLAITTRIPQWFTISDSIKKIVIDENQTESYSTELPIIMSSQVSMSPPQYTNQPVLISQTPNIKVLENSLVEWKYQFSNSENHYFWVDAFSQPQPLVLKEDGFFYYSKLIDQTGIYRIAVRLKGEEDIELTNLGDVNTIEVIADSPPKIQIIEPQQTLLEIANTGNPEFNLLALVKDDYAIASTKILASVAKGSGEAVKFRDHTFYFDQFSDEEVGLLFASSRRYTKRWLLSDLQMDPGDEVYFNIVATDNKHPEPQITKSNTIIVRWLDQKIEALNSDGIKIGFIQEYFRSQRQIIIETEQLIADQHDLTQLLVLQKSKDLGHSQRDLKEKFGQFLGDEFGEGESAPVDFADEHHTEESSESNEQPDVEHKNSHQEQHATESASGDLQQLISQFGHNHGGTEVTALSNKDPKSWMKKAVMEMWQAELHLMLAEPEKAVVFEYKAYHFLKLARQADRIYTKRLGFEPPPVSEDNRLKGELTNVSSYAVSIEDLEDPMAIQQLISKVYQHFNNLPKETKISEATINDFKLLRAFLLTQSKQRPALINYVATVEKILLAQTINLSNCEECVKKLRQKLWQLSSPGMSYPLVNQQFNLLDKELQKSYFRSVLNLQKSDVEVEKVEDHD